VSVTLVSVVLAAVLIAAPTRLLIVQLRTVLSLIVKLAGTFAEGSLPTAIAVPVLSCTVQPDMDSTPAE
jgi:hypothetical protein